MASTLHAVFDVQWDVVAPFAVVRLPDVWDGPRYANYALELSGATLLAVWPRRGMFEDHGPRWPCYRPP